MDNVAILKEIKEQCPESIYFHAFKDKEITEGILTAGKLLGIHDATILTARGDDEEFRDFCKKVHSALKNDVKGVSFSSKEIGYFFKLENDPNTPEGSNKIPSHINNYITFSEADVKMWVDYFEDYLTIQDVTNEYKILELDDGLDTIGLIVKASLLNTGKIKVNDNYKFIIKESPFQKGDHLIVNKTGLPLFGYEKASIGRIGKAKK